MVIICYRESDERETRRTRTKGRILDEDMSHQKRFFLSICFRSLQKGVRRRRFEHLFYLCTYYIDRLPCVLPYVEVFQINSFHSGISYSYSSSSEDSSSLLSSSSDDAASSSSLSVSSSSSTSSSAGAFTSAFSFVIKESGS